MMSHRQAAIALVVTIVGVIAYLALAAALNVKESWVGWLFLTQWGMMEGAKPERIPASALGAAFGMLLSALLVHLPPLIGPAGVAIPLVLILASVYALTVGWLKLIINGGAFIFLTVCDIPAVMKTASTADQYIALAYGVFFFGGLIWLSTAVGKARAGRKPAADAVTPASAIAPQSAAL